MTQAVTVKYAGRAGPGTVAQRSQSCRDGYCGDWRPAGPAPWPDEPPVTIPPWQSPD